MMAMMQSGMDYCPIRSPWQGMARVAQAIMGGQMMREAYEREMAGRSAVIGQLPGLMGSGQTGGDAARIASITMSADAGGATSDNPVINTLMQRRAAGATSIARSILTWPDPERRVVYALTQPVTIIRSRV
jgi:hypothetical protein